MRHFLLNSELLSQGSEERGGQLRVPIALREENQWKSSGLILEPSLVGLIEFAQVGDCVDEDWYLVFTVVRVCSDDEVDRLAVKYTRKPLVVLAHAPFELHRHNIAGASV